MSKTNLILPHFSKKETINLLLEFNFFQNKGNWYQYLHPVIVFANY